MEISSHCPQLDEVEMEDIETAEVLGEQTMFKPVAGPSAPGRKSTRQESCRNLLQKYKCAGAAAREDAFFEEAKRCR